MKKNQRKEYEIEFNAKGLTSGIYFYKLNAGSYVGTMKHLRILNSNQKYFSLCILFLLLNSNFGYAQLTQITTDPAMDWDPYWSPGGDSLVFTSNRSGNDDLWIVPLTGGTPSQLTFNQTGDYHPCWSPTASVIAFCSERNGNQDIWTIPSSGGTATQVTTYLGRDESLNWSPDGDSIVFDSNRSGGNWDIWKIPVAGGTAQRITTHSANDGGPSWSRDGMTIAFTSARNGYAKIWLIPSWGGTATQLSSGTASDHQPEWSPNDSLIVFISDRSGNWDIWTIPSDGGNATQLTTNPGNDMYPCWSPDGAMLAFTSDRSGNRDIWVIDVSSILAAEEKSENWPTSFGLYQNYPNPFNPSTKIKYSIPQSSKVAIKVFDILGNEIETLVNEEKPAGTYEVEFDASRLTSEIYFYRLKAGSYSVTKKMIFLK